MTEMLEKAHLVYFSPTGTTRTTCAQIAKGLAAQKIIHYDLTLPGDLLATTLTEDVVIFGVPVYAGRVPELCLQRFDQCRRLRDVLCVRQNLRSGCTAFQPSAHRRETGAAAAELQDAESPDAVPGLKIGDT